MTDPDLHVLASDEETLLARIAATEPGLATGQTITTAQLITFAAGRHAVRAAECMPKKELR